MVQMKRAQRHLLKICINDILIFRIANGKFTIDNDTYLLIQNDGNNHLHGGNVVIIHLLGWDFLRLI